MFSWLHTNIPNPILWELGPIQIHWYGLMILLGIVLALLVCLYLANRLGIKRDDVWDMSFWLVLGAIVGARLYEVFIVSFDFYWRHPEDIIKIWQGGLAIHGAWIGGLIVAYLYARRRNLKILKLLDLVSFGTILGQAIGRWGNYFNQELYGRPTDLPWGIPIQPYFRLPGFESFQYFHPAFLYESLANLLILIILFIVLKYRKRDGQIFFIYLGLYSLTRLLTEFIRIDPTPMVSGLRFPAVLSVFMIMIAIVGFVFTWQKTSRDIS